MLWSLLHVFMYIEFGGVLNYSMGLSGGVITLLAGQEFVKNVGFFFHDFSIKNICRITTFNCFNNIWKIHLVIQKFANSMNTQIHHTTALSYFNGNVTSSVNLSHQRNKELKVATVSEFFSYFRVTYNYKLKILWLSSLKNIS